MIVKQSVIFSFLYTATIQTVNSKIATKCVSGYLIIGTFSSNGPRKCSGLDIKQYDEDELTMELKNGFDKIQCVTEDHLTPFNTTQNFLFCSFKKQL